MLHTVAKVVPEGTKGGKRPEAANHRNAAFAYESQSIKPDPARSRQLVAFTSTCSGSFQLTGI